MTSSEIDRTAPEWRTELTSRQKRTWIIFAGLLILIAAGVFGFLRRDAVGDLLFGTSSGASAEAESMPANSNEFPAVLIEQVDGYKHSVYYSGAIRSANRTTVAFQRAGLITDILARDGTAVSAGQPLAQMDTRQLQASLESRTAKLAQAQAQLDEMNQGPRQETIAAARSAVDDLSQQWEAAKLRLQRSEKLVQASAIARQDYEQELFATRGLEARIQTAQSQLDELLAGTRPEQIAAQESLIQSIKSERQGIQFQLDDCMLVAPFAGIVVDQMIDPGTVVDAGTPVMELIDHLNLEIHVGIPFDAGSELQPGQQIQGVVGEVPFSARLRTILPAVDSGSQTRRAVFDVERTSLSTPAIVAGQLAQIRLPKVVRERGCWIPAAAITSDHSGLWSCLTVEPVVTRPSTTASALPENRRISGIARKQSVEVLHQQDDWLFVRGTLENGQWLIADGLHRVVPGQQVTARLDPEPWRPELDENSLTSLKPTQPSGSGAVSTPSRGEPNPN